MSLTRRLVFGSNPRRTAIRVLVLALVSFVTFGWILIPIRAEGVSMQPTYQSGTLHLVNRLAFLFRPPARGDVVAIRLAGPHVLYVKRVVGLPGERLKISAGQLYVNGVSLDEPYVRIRRSWEMEEVTLTPREYLVIGDNRGQSDLGRVDVGKIASMVVFLMGGGRAVRIVGVIAAIGVAAVAWRLWWPRATTASSAAILQALCDEVNASTTDGIGSVARAAAIGSYFTVDVVVDLGQGTALINGRDTLMGMAARLQPRTAAFRLKLDDVDVQVHPGNAVADVSLTASFIRRSVSTGEESIDAREFGLVISKADGAWRISHLTAVDTLK